MASPVTPEISMKIAAWRQKAAEGTLTLDDMKEAIIYLRAGRVNAQSASAAAKRKKAIIAIPSAADMLNDLENM